MTLNAPWLPRYKGRKRKKYRKRKEKRKKYERSTSGQVIFAVAISQSVFTLSRLVGTRARPDLRLGDQDLSSRCLRGRGSRGRRVSALSCSSVCALCSRAYSLPLLFLFFRSCALLSARAIPPPPLCFCLSVCVCVFMSIIS